MNEATARKFMSQLLAGVQHCHSCGVAHRDLKLENVLLTKEGVVKVIDFGLSHIYQKGANGDYDRSVPLREMCGSKSYAAPEVLSGAGYDGFLADVWSLGVCLFAMLSGFFPLDEAANNDWRFDKLVKSQREKRCTTETVYSWYKRSAKHLSREVVHLLDSLLTIDPQSRLTMGQAREHPWVKEQKFGGAQLADQGSFQSGLYMEDGDEPRYRGAMGGGFAEPSDAMVEDDDAPVYRSLGMGAEALEEELGGGGAPMAVPALGRQKGRLNLLEPPPELS